MASTLSKEQRERRDALILELFLSGHSERAIARHVNLSAARTGAIVAEQLEAAAARFQAVGKQALVVYSARLEMLIKGIWDKATSGEDTKATEVARHLLEQQARLHGIGDDPKMPAPDSELADAADELRKYRERHRRPPEAI